MIERISKTTECVDKFTIERCSLDCVIPVFNRVYGKKIGLFVFF